MKILFFLFTFSVSIMLIVFFKTHGIYSLPKNYRILDCRDLGLDYEQTITNGKLDFERCLYEN